MFPDQDLDRITQWLERRSDEIPERVRDQIRYELDVEAHAVVIYECRPPLRPDLGPEWTRVPFARLWYTKRHGDWTLYWFDRNGRFQRYDFLDPNQNVGALLSEIDDDPTALFWGLGVFGGSLGTCSLGPAWHPPETSARSGAFRIETRFDVDRRLGLGMGEDNIGRAVTGDGCVMGNRDGGRHVEPCHPVPSPGSDRIRRARVSDVVVPFAREV